MHVCVFRFRGKTQKNVDKIKNKYTRAARRSALRQLAVEGGAAEGEDYAEGVFEGEGAAFGDPAVGEDDDGFDAAGIRNVFIQGGMGMYELTLMRR